MQKKLWTASSNCLRTDLAKNNPQSKETKNITASGISVSAGIVMGRALFVGRDLGTAKEIVLNAQEAKEEVRRFREALDKSRQQLAELRKQVGDIIGEQDAQIFDAHLLIMDDDNLIKEINDLISHFFDYSHELEPSFGTLFSSSFHFFQVKHLIF